MIVNDNMLNFADKIAKKSSLAKQKMSAILVNNKNPVPYLYGFNYYLDKSCYKQKFSIHAEEELILNAAKKGICLHGSTILVYRKTDNNEFGVSKPCHICHAKLIKAGVRNVIYYDGENWVKANLKKLPVTVKIKQLYP